MGCVFEASREQPNQCIKQQTQNQCSLITTSKTVKDNRVEEIKVEDNYQQNHKPQTATATRKNIKATTQVLFVVPQQQQLSQEVYDNKDALAAHNIWPSTKPNALHINCWNCNSRNLKINKDEQQCRRQHLCQFRTTRFSSRNHYIATWTSLAGISCLRLHKMLLEARDALATPLDEPSEEQRKLEEDKDEDKPFEDLHWHRHNVTSTFVPATMSAAILSSLTATLAIACQYLAQHYKAHSQSFSFYAASSIILMLCYLTTTSTAAATQSETAALDKHPIFDESSSDKEILDLLLEKKRYDKRLLPPVNDEDFCCGLQSPDMASNQNARRPHNRGTLTVNVNVLLLSLASPDESSLKYEVEFLLNQQWNDPRLQYGNKSHYDFLNALHHHDSIWTPDTYFIMHGDFKDPIIPMHFALRIFRNGTITYAMRRHLILSCQGSLHIFPFDDPKCSFSMESISYEEAQIKYVWKNDEDTLRKSPSLTTLNAYLIKNQTTACDQNSWRGNYSCLQVELTFTRDRAYYFTTVFIPGIILVTSSFITFWLEWNAVPARVMIGVTTMLNFFTTSNGFRSTLPVVSNLTAMNVWDGVCMCFIYASLLEFVCVNYVGRKRPLHNVVYRPGENPVTQRLPAVLSRIGVILASPLPGEKRRDAGAPNEIVACTTCGGSSSPCTHSVNNGCATETCFVQMRKKEPPHPIRVAKTIDVIARITFPTAYAIFLIFFFVHYKGFS
ncbi:glycine receptor subunit alpha-4 isoform X17 [Drosophila grimshawi]|uniref:glycine receptor subunit alpha-4 isoform X17 n=1 Tax=Drosophila grimshawi TaxID=7222 RepID=UPI000C86F98A|nr:glycine receptor subunit alpha-4 isoform X17 [Drosophila grimshawi]